MKTSSSPYSTFARLGRLGSRAGALLATIGVGTVAFAAPATDINTAGPTDDVTITGAVQTLAGSTTIHSLVINTSTEFHGLSLGSAAYTLTISSGSIDFQSDHSSIDGPGTIAFGTATGDVYGKSRNFLGQSGGLTLTGSGGVTYSGNVTLVQVTALYTGATLVESGTLTLGLAVQNRIPDASALTIAAGATLGADSRMTVSETFGSLAGAGTISINPSGTSPTLIMGGDNTSTTFSGALNGNFNLTKNGSGTFTYTGSGTNVGTLAVNGGAVMLNGSLTNGATTVASGATLGGTGALGAATIASGATLAPGGEAGAIGKLTFHDDTTLAGNVQLQLQGGARGLADGYDAVDVASGTLTYGGTLTLDITGLLANGTYNLFDFSGSEGNFANVLFGGGYYGGAFALDGSTWSALSRGQSFAFNAMTGDLVVVPEPRAFSLLGAIGLAYLMRRRRKGEHAKRRLPGALPFSALLLFGFAGGLFAQEPTRLPGMIQEIEVKTGKDLGVSAPSGDVVAVLDQHTPMENPEASKSQDHHNGWLELSANQVEGNEIIVKGKYYIPASSTAPARALRLTIRKRTPEGLAVYADKSVELKEERDQWFDFEVRLPLDENQPAAEGTRFVLMLSAVPFAGPVYLDNLQVTDPQDNGLWPYPEFE